MAVPKLNNIQIPPSRSFAPTSATTPTQDKLQIDEPTREMLLKVLKADDLKPIGDANRRLGLPDGPKYYCSALMLAKFKQLHPDLVKTKEPLNGVLTADWKRALERYYFNMTYLKEVQSQEVQNV